MKVNMCSFFWSGHSGSFNFSLSGGGSWFSGEHEIGESVIDYVYKSTFERIFLLKVESREVVEIKCNGNDGLTIEWTWHQKPWHLV